MKRQMTRAAKWMAAPVLMLAIASSASAAGVDSLVVAVRNDFAPGGQAPVVVPEGGQLTFVNADLTIHSVTSVDTDAQGVSLFDTREVFAAQAAPVAGVDQLAPGSYGFRCILHPWMVGTVTVV